MQPYPFVNHNGINLSRDTANISVRNSAFRYGYGLFETMLVMDGVIQLKELHWERLFEGLRLLKFQVTAHFTASFLEEESLKTIKRNKAEKICRVRLQVYANDEGLSPVFLIECFEIEKRMTELNEEGLVVGIAERIAKNADATSHLKTTSYLPYFLAAKHAKEKGWDDALVLNQHRRVIESTIANIFWIKDNVIYTPPISEGCIAGVMRRHLLIELPRNGFKVSESILTDKILADADEVFITNAIRKIKWVKRIEKNQFANENVKLVNKLIFECLRNSF